MIQIDCTVCGQRHRMGDCPGAAKLPTVDGGYGVKVMKPPKTRVPGDLSAGIPVRETLDDMTWRVGYNAFMREYMQRRRAKAKT